MAVSSFDPSSLDSSSATARPAAAERAERLARLRRPPVADPAAAAGGDEAAALAAFLDTLSAGRPPPSRLPAPVSATVPVSAPPAAVLNFHCAPAEASEPRAASATRPGAGLRPLRTGDLDHLPGVGPELVWALTRAGVARRADLARMTPDDLAARLGPVGRLAPVADWIAQARAAVDA